MESDDLGLNSGPATGQLYNTGPATYTLAFSLLTHSAACVSPPERALQCTGPCICAVAVREATAPEPPPCIGVDSAALNFPASSPMHGPKSAHPLPALLPPVIGRGTLERSGEVPGLFSNRMWSSWRGQGSGRRTSEGLCSLRGGEGTPQGRSWVWVSATTVRERTPLCCTGLVSTAGGAVPQPPGGLTQCGLAQSPVVRIRKKFI